MVPVPGHEFIPGTGDVIEVLQLFNYLRVSGFICGFIDRSRLKLFHAR